MYYNYDIVESMVVMLRVEQLPSVLSNHNTTDFTLRELISTCTPGHPNIYRKSTFSLMIFESIGYSITYDINLNL